MNPAHLTDSEINARVFANAKPSDHRGLNDGFTDSELMTIFSDDGFKHRSRAMRDWFYAWFDQYLTEQGG